MPLLIQGKLAQLLILKLQFKPVNAVKHAHAYELSAFKQLPPLRQGLEAHFLNKKNTASFSIINTYIIY